MKKSFSYIEVIISLLVILLILIPSVKINSLQFLTQRQINSFDKGAETFSQILCYLEKENYFFEHDLELNFKSTKDLLTNPIFKNLSIQSVENLNLQISIKTDSIDFKSKMITANIIYLKYKNKNKILEGKILKFKD